MNTVLNEFPDSLLHFGRNGLPCPAFQESTDLDLTVINQTGGGKGVSLRKQNISFESKQIEIKVIGEICCNEIHPFLFLLLCPLATQMAPLCYHSLTDSRKRFKFPSDF